MHVSLNPYAAQCATMTEIQKRQPAVSERYLTQHFLLDELYGLVMLEWIYSPLESVNSHTHYIF